MRHAVVNKETKKVANVIIWDGVSQWSPPAGHDLIRHDKCDIGDIYDATKNSFSKPVAQ
jgi:hypothetical protein